MGTDIHSVFEVQGEDGVWRAIYVDNPTEEELEWLRWKTFASEERGEEPPKGVVLGWGDRNYNTFGIIADVRNGRGFAGVQTGEGFEPIAEGRGIPDDASPESKEMSEGNHSPTWVSLAELLDTGWQKKVTKCYGTITVEAYLEWRKENIGKEFPAPPDIYCGAVWGRDVVAMDAEDIERQLTTIGKALATHVRIGWKATYAECAKWFMEFIYSRVVPLGHDPNRVRMVMSFDS